MTDQVDDPSDIRGWQRLSDRVTTSGKLDPGDPARLAAKGIAYTHIPVPFDAQVESHYAAFKAALAEGEGPVHVHCIMNWRVSGMPDSDSRTIMTQQWDPLSSDDPRTAPWRSLLERLT